MPAWIDPPDVAVPPALQEAVGGHPLVAAVLARRGVAQPEAALAFLDPQRYIPAPPEDFPGMDAACARIEAALQRGERVWVWGDFDVDGQTSTAVLVSLLRNLGGDPRYHIPVRAREGHGVNIPNLKSILDEGCDLLLTCDTGITAHEALAYAQEHRVDVIVTDHHVLGESLPPALAHITPRLLPEGHPLGTLPGVGVAFKLAEALFARAGRPQAAEGLLDLAALGIVADVAQQVQDARYLLQRGLQALRQARRPGLNAVMQAAELNPAFLSEEHIGFTIAPRLNALGRLDDANPAVELFTTNDETRARALALQLETLNARRQLLTNQVLQAAEKQLERDTGLLDAPAIVLAHPDWPGGILGIAASALVERYHKPAILLAAPSGRPAGGSARSVEGVDITACIASQRSLLRTFGGHPMAAGLSIDAENLPAFRRGLYRAVEAAIDAQGGLPEPGLIIDGDLRLDELSLDLVADFERLAPFGPGNPPLVFAIRDLQLAAAVKIGREKEHVQLTVEDQTGLAQKVLWWGGARNRLPEGRFDLACVLRASDFRGQRDVQVECVDYALRRAPDLTPAAPQRAILDYRDAPYPRPLLDQLRAEPGLVLWAEGAAREKLGALDRTRLTPGNTLAIWTAPPNRLELQRALETVQPERVVLFGLPPETDEVNAFLTRLTGLVKFSLRESVGESAVAPVEADAPRLAGAAAQPETAVRLGLEYLHVRGIITLEKDADGAWRFLPGTAVSSGDPQPILLRLKAVLQESAAYRAYFRAAALSDLGI